jgi:hypothetical protein
MNTLHRNPNGDCIVRVDKVSQDDNCLAWSFSVVAGPGKGSKVGCNTSLTEPFLWKLRHVLEGLGITVPNGPMNLDLNNLVGLIGGAAVNDGQIVNFYQKPPVDNEFTDRTQRAIDKARADLDAALDRYVQAKIADSEDIERWQYRARGKAR